MDLNESTNITDVYARYDISYWEQILTGILIGLVGILGIMGNSMIILAVSFSRKLHSSTNAFVTSLSLADLITSFFLLFYMVGVFGRNSWPIPRAPWLCALTGIMMIVCTGTSLYTMALISINRLLLITKPSLYKKIFVSWKLVICLMIPWTILGGIVSIFIMRSGFSIFGYNKHDLACGINTVNVNAGLLASTVTLISFPIPLIITTICYIWIFVYLRRHFQKQKRNLRKSSLLVPSADEMNMISPGTSHTHTSAASALVSGPSSLVSGPSTLAKEHFRIQGAPVTDDDPSPMAEECSQIEGGPTANGHYTLVSGPSAMAKEHFRIEGAPVDNDDPSTLAKEHSLIEGVLIANGHSTLASGPSSLSNGSSTVAKEHFQIEGAPLSNDDQSALREGHCHTEGAPTANGHSALAKIHSHVQEAVVTRMTTTKQKRWDKKQIKITKNLFMAVCSLYLCFLPYLILAFVPNSGHILFYTRVITLANGAINFWIYAGKHPDFKIVFGHMIRRSFADIPQPSRFLKFLLSHMSQNM